MEPEKQPSWPRGHKAVGRLCSGDRTSSQKFSTFWTKIFLYSLHASQDSFISTWKAPLLVCSEKFMPFQTQRDSPRELKHEFVWRISCHPSLRKKKTSDTCMIPHKAASATSLVVLASKSLSSSKALEILKAPRAAPAKFTASGPSSKAAKFPMRWTGRLPHLVRWSFNSGRRKKRYDSILYRTNGKVKYSIVQHVICVIYMPQICLSMCAY